MSNPSPFKRAIAIAGGPTALARHLGVERQNVANWCRRGVPADRCIDVEQAVAGAVTRHELRPDVFGAHAVAVATAAATGTEDTNAAPTTASVSEAA